MIFYHHELFIKLIFKELKKSIFLLKIQFDTSQYFNKLKNSESYFQTFINTESLATGVIFLKPGQNDTQEPRHFCAQSFLNESRNIRGCRWRPDQRCCRP